MGDLVNLRVWRKRKAKEQDAQTAAVNRAVSGRSKQVKRLQETAKARAAALLEQHRINGDEGSGA